MANRPRYKRVVVKVSGESFGPQGGVGIDPSAVQATAHEISPLVEMGVQVALVVGGGNFIRGRELLAGLGDSAEQRARRVTADYMGMLATVINALALREALESLGVAVRVLSAITMTAVCEPFILRRATRHLEKGRVIILAGGTGNPFFTTDTCAALRASEINAEVLLKATKVDGVFDSDPQTNPNARRYDRISYEKVLVDRLGVMDLTAISMCMENRIPIVVFQLSKLGSLSGLICGENIGTVISE